MAVVHPGNPDEQRENKRERERETGRWGLRERQGEAEGKRERERGTDGMRPELLRPHLGGWLLGWLLGKLLVCSFAYLSIRFDAGVLVCSLSSLCLQRQGGRERERV